MGTTTRKRRGERRFDRDALLQSIESWDDIRFFLAIHRAGTLSAAARPLQVTQPTCGRRLAALEAALGLRLFDRTPEGLRLTSAGAALLDAATMMEQSACDLALRASMTDRDLEGVVRIGSTELFASSFLVGALPELRERYPGIRVELVLSNQEADLMRREADFAFRFRPEGLRPSPEVLAAQKLGDEQLALFGTDAYLHRRGAPRDPSELSGHEVVVYSDRHPAAQWCERAYRNATVVLTCPSMQVTAAAMAAGVGLGVLPYRAARLYPQLRALSGVVARGTGWLVVHPDLRRVPRIRVVIDVLVGMFRADRVVI